METWFRTVMGLPTHPLVDHFAVVLFPLGLIGLLFLLVSRRLRARYGWLTMLVLTVGTVCVLVAKESGEQLATMIGTPKRHAHYADLLVLAALPTWLVAVVWYLLRRHRDRVLQRTLITSDTSDRAGSAPGDGSHPVTSAPTTRSLPTMLLGLLTAVGAVASLVLVTVVGHTGAEATWAGTATSSSTPAPSGAAASASGSASTAASASASASTGSYTMAQVATHNSSSSCWSVINGSVYNLTAWITQHPGGSDKILAICGKDGSSAYNAQHASDARPQQILATYKIGTLAG